MIPRIRTATNASLTPLALAIAIAVPAAAEDKPDFTAASAVKFVKSYCLDCHVGDEAESGLNLEEFGGASDLTNAIESWNQIALRVGERQMPPDGSDMPTDEARTAFVTWIRSTIFRAVCDDRVSPGRPMIRRMNRTEYANTVRDLLGIHINAGHALP
ncbi:MAG: DUF1587 domain-containing protein, partial [Rubripirellula sp.]